MHMCVLLTLPKVVGTCIGIEESNELAADGDELGED